MKTTVEIRDPLFRRAKKYCAEHGIPLRALIEDGLRQILEPPPPKRFRLKRFGFRGEGPIGPSDWPSIREIVYEGRGGAGTPDDRR
ncbi:MAG: hypothetical protein ACRD8O_04520 [Bryobacteraceae bacterium]